jgi:hypothetical protein
MMILVFPQFLLCGIFRKVRAVAHSDGRTGKFLTVARTDKDRAETSLALCNVSAQFFA